MTPVVENILVYDVSENSDAILSILRENGHKVSCLKNIDDILPLLLESAMVKALVINVPAVSEAVIALLIRLKEEKPQVNTMVISGDVSVSRAVDVMKAGAYDYLMSPVDTTSFLFNIEKMIAADTSEEEKVKRKISNNDKIVTRNSAMIQMLGLLDQVADSTASVLIQGESGTGKELVARYIHEKSSRKNKQFIALNCAALPDNLLESELFGHEKGAFTGAVGRKPGKFELADGGTILLDEITEMPLHLQSKLLRVLQEREVDRLGGTMPVKVDVRIIATTNREIERSVEQNEFRGDLFYRLNVIPVKIPALRNRKDDIELLVTHFIDKFNSLDGRDVKSLTTDGLNSLLAYDFPGNVRELENLMHRGVLLANGPKINAGNLFPGQLADNRNNSQAEITMTQIPEGISDVPLKEVEKKVIFHTLDKTSGNRTHAAKILGISVRTLRNKLNEYKS